MAAARTGATGVVRRHRDEIAARPLELVIQLAAKLEPALIEDDFVQADFGLHVLAIRKSVWAPMTDRGTSRQPKIAK